MFTFQLCRLISLVACVMFLAGAASAQPLSFFWAQQASPPLSGLIDASPTYAAPRSNARYGLNSGEAGAYAWALNGVSALGPDSAATIMRAYRQNITCRPVVDYTGRCFGPDGHQHATRFTVLRVTSTPAEDDRLITASIRVLRTGGPGAVAFFSNGSGNEPGRVTRLGEGRYRVQMGQAAGREASIQTSSRSFSGLGWRHCNPVGWANGSVNVECFDASGRRIDSDFDIVAFRALRRPSENNAPFDVLWNDNPTDPRAAPGYSVSADGGTQSARRLGRGRYEIELGLSANPGGHVVASGYGSAHCIVDRWWGASRVDLLLWAGWWAPGLPIHGGGRDAPDCIGEGAALGHAGHAKL